MENNDGFVPVLDEKELAGRQNETGYPWRAHQSYSSNSRAKSLS